MCVYLFVCLCMFVCGCGWVGVCAFVCACVCMCQHVCVCMLINMRTGTTSRAKCHVSRGLSDTFSLQALRDTTRMLDAKLQVGLHISNDANAAVQSSFHSHRWEAVQRLVSILHEQHDAEVRAQSINRSHRP